MERTACSSWCSMIYLTKSFTCIIHVVSGWCTGTQVGIQSVFEDAKECSGSSFQSRTTEGKKDV